MKRLILITLLVFACTKPSVEPSVQDRPHVFKDIFFTRHEIGQSNIGRRSVPVTSFKSPTANKGYVLYLDFDGYQMLATDWWVTYYGMFPSYFAPSGLSAEDQKRAYDTTVSKFNLRQFRNLSITTNEEDYNNAPITKRLRVVITETWEPFGEMYGGISLVGSFRQEQPAFVFSSNMYWNPEYVGRAVAHETGHAFGLYHQTDNHTDSTGKCILDKVYGRNKIMGWSYDPGSVWTIGHPFIQFSLNLCDDYQDDIAKIAGVLKSK